MGWGQQDAANQWATSLHQLNGSIICMISYLELPLTTNKCNLQLQLAGTIPAKLLLQLTTAFREGGLCDRSGTFSYKDHIHKSNVPILALAGDRDLICPPEAVEGTLKFKMIYISTLFDVNILCLFLMMIWMDQILLSSFLSTWLPIKYLESLEVHIMPIMIWWEDDWYELFVVMA
jgi:hypothetical protein